MRNRPNKFIFSVEIAKDTVIRFVPLVGDMPKAAPPDGWKIREALAEALDPDLVKVWLEADRAYQPLDSWGQLVRINSGAYIDPNELKLAEDYDAAYAKMIHAFYQKMLSGDLIGYGRQGSRLVDHTPIPSSAWLGLRITDIIESVVAEISAQKLEIFDVRIFCRGQSRAQLSTSPSTRRRPVGEEVAKALEMVGLQNSRKGHSYAEIAEMIRPHLRWERKSADEHHALLKAIQRHYQSD